MSIARACTIRDDARRRQEMRAESDADILARVGSGDLAALGVLYDRYHECVHRLAHRATGTAADADDITHETFLALARMADRYDGRLSARPLVLGIASKLALGHRRTLARCGQVLRAFAGVMPSGSAPSPEGVASATEELARFERALQGLSPRKRVVILMVDAEGLGGEEVARALDIPLGTVWTRLHHARAEMRRALSR